EPIEGRDHVRAGDVVHAVSNVHLGWFRARGVNKCDAGRILGSRKVFVRSRPALAFHELGARFTFRVRLNFNPDSASDIEIASCENAKARDRPIKFCGPARGDRSTLARFLLAWLSRIRPINARLCVAVTALERAGLES